MISRTSGATIELSLQANFKERNNVNRLDKQSLRDLIKPLAIALKGKRIKMTKGSGTGLLAMFLRLSDSVLFNRFTKDELSRIFHSFTQNYVNICNVAATDSRLTEAWKLILQSPQTDSKNLKDILKREIVVRQPDYWDMQPLCDCLFWPLTVTEQIRFSRPEPGYAYKFTINADVRSKLAVTFLGENSLVPETTENLPEGSNFIVDNFENNMSADLAFLSSLAMTGNPLSANGSISAARLKSIKKNFATADFQPSAAIHPLDRIELLVNTYFTQDLSKTKVSDPRVFAGFVAENASRHISDTRFGAFLPALKGFTKAWASDSYVMEISEAVNNLLLPAAKVWMPLDNLKLRYLCYPTPSWSDSAYLSLFNRHSLNRASVRRKEDQTATTYYGEAVARINIFDDIDFPFVLHWIKFLCAAGLVEIASEQNCDAGDTLEGMRYVRLTPLGRYAFKIDKSYNPKPAVRNYDLEFDDRNCIFTINSENYPFRIFLNQITKPIGQTRFRISAASLLKGCADSHGLQARIESLRNIVDINSSETLKSIIKEAIARAECVEHIPNSYTILRLKPGSQDLADFIISNKEIRPNIILCEKNIILVKKNFFESFSLICRKQGFII